MNRLLLSVALLGGAVAAHAAGDGWLTSYDQAVKASKKSGLPILADFTGSDWCPPCQMLTKEIFETPVFKKWAKTNVVLLKLDFPRFKPQTPATQKQNRSLATKFKIESFPTVVFMKPDGKVIQRMEGYSSTGPSFWTKNAETILKNTGRAMRFAPQAAGQQSNAPVAEPGYPAYVTAKTLYAKNDLRGMKAPKIEAEKWLTTAPPKDLKGKVILVDLWATWCPPCRELIPELNEWSKQFKDDLVVIGISDEKPEVVQKFLEKTPAIYSIGVDAKSRVGNAVQVQGIPHVLVISPDGVVRWQGFPQETKDRLTTEVLKQIIDASKAATTKQ